MEKREGENWKGVRGFEDCYEVSDRGRIRSLTRYIETSQGHIRRYEGKILKSTPNNHGILTNVLYLSHNSLKIKARFQTNRLILETFQNLKIGRQFDIRHTNGNREDCRLENLRIVPKSETLRNRKPYIRKKCKISNEDIVDIENMRILEIPIKDIMKEYNVSNVTIYKALRRENPIHKTVPVPKRMRNIDYRIKVPFSKIEKIRKLYKEGNSQTSLSKRFGLSDSYISQIVRRKVRVNR